MVICSCNVISEQDIKSAVSSLSRRSPDSKLSASNILEEIGCRHDCFGCVPLLKRITRETLEG